MFLAMPLAHSMCDLSQPGVRPVLPTLGMWNFCCCWWFCFLFLSHWTTREVLDSICKHSGCEDQRRERGQGDREGLETGPDAEGRGLARLWVEEDLVPLAPGKQGRTEGQKVPLGET